MPYCNLGTCDADFLIKFLSLYKKNESLWRVKSKIYYDKARKKREYAEMVALMRTVEPDFTVEDVKKKVNSLRSSFRKELKKVEESLVNDEPYVPKLWYFNHLLFLKETELEDSASTSKVNDEDNFDVAERLYFENDDPLDWEGSKSSHDLPEPSSSNTKTIKTYIENTKLRTEPTENRKRVRDMMEDDCDVISRHIAVKLRSLTKEQKIHAEKLINDVLYEGQLNNLSRRARVVVEEDQRAEERDVDDSGGMKQEYT